MILPIVKAVSFEELTVTVSMFVVVNAPTVPVKEFKLKVTASVVAVVPVIFTVVAAMLAAAAGEKFTLTAPVPYAAELFAVAKVRVVPSA